MPVILDFSHVSVHVQILMLIVAIPLIIQMFAILILIFVGAIIILVNSHCHHKCSAYRLWIIIWEIALTSILGAGFVLFCVK